MTVGMTLAEKLHHTSRGQKIARVGEEVEHKKHAGLRAQKTPPPKERPGGARAAAERPHRAALGLLQLATPSLASPASEAADSSALSFLVRRAVEDRKKEEEEAKKKVVTAARAVASSMASFQATAVRSVRQDALWWESLTPAQQGRDGGGQGGSEEGVGRSEQGGAQEEAEEEEEKEDEAVTFLICVSGVA